MQLNKRNRAMIIAFTIIGTSAACAQGAIDRLQPLIETGEFSQKGCKAEAA
jgi:hypothetical protein